MTMTTPVGAPGDMAGLGRGVSREAGVNAGFPAPPRALCSRVPRGLSDRAWELAARPWASSWSGAGTGCTARLRATPVVSGSLHPQCVVPGTRVMLSAHLQTQTGPRKPRHCRDLSVTAVTSDHRASGTAQQL